MREIVLHVGLHKTGSTLLQRVLNAGATTLAEQGLRVVSRDQLYALDGSTWAIRGLLDGLEREPQRIARVANTIRQLLQPESDERVVLSDETLLGWRVSLDYPGNAYECGIPVLRWLVDRVSDETPVRVIMYVRRQDRFFESMYMQNVHEGSIEPFTTWCERIDPARLNWLSLADHVEAEVGPGNLVVRPFETIGEGAVEFCEDFLRIVDPVLGLPLSREEVERIAATANRGLSQKALDIASLTYPILDVQERVALRRFLQKTFSSVNYPKPELLTTEQSVRILDQHEAENRELFARYMPDATPGAFGYFSAPVLGAS